MQIFDIEIVLLHFCTLSFLSHKLDFTANQAQKNYKRNLTKIYQEMRNKEHALSIRLFRFLLLCETNEISSVTWFVLWENQTKQQPYKNKHTYCSVNFSNIFFTAEKCHIPYMIWIGFYRCTMVFFRFKFSFNFMKLKNTYVAFWDDCSLLTVYFAASFFELIPIRFRI